MAPIGNATKHGFLVREGDALERLAAVSRIAFDKTSTLTYGTPQVVAVQSFQQGLSEQALYAAAASAEMRSEHPLGKAVVHCYWKKTHMEPQPATQFQMLPGRGVAATVEERQVLSGNLELLQEKRIVIPALVQEAVKFYQQKGCTVILLAADGQMARILALSDAIREDAADMVAQVKQAGVTPVLLTGDHENAAGQIADQLQIDEVRVNCLPEQKLEWIDQYQAAGSRVCMIGDGINDAPALKKAYVGIAMGGIGSDIAVDAADIALVDDEIRELPHLLRLARRMMITIKCNLAFSMTLNFIAIILAMNGVLNPVVGALVHNAGSVLVILNSALLLKWRKRK